MKTIVSAVIIGLVLVGGLSAQQPRRMILPAVPGPAYRLTVTPLNWKFASKTGLSSHRIEEQVRLRLLEGLGWSQQLDKPKRGQARLTEGKVRVELSIIEAKRQKVAYSFRVVVDTPEDWLWVTQRKDGLAAWHWEQGGEGASKLGDYPRKFRQDLDEVLKDLVQAWQARFK